MAQSYLTLVSYRTGDTEGLKSLADGCSCVGGSAAVLLDGDGRAGDVGPAGVFKADGLDLLNLSVYIQSCILCNLFSFLQ